MSDLTWGTDWTSVVIVDDMLGPNNYNMTVSFDVTTDNAEEQNIAFGRIKYFINNILRDSVIISHGSRHLDYFLDNTEQNTIVLADKPSDLVVLASLFKKFNSITEGRIDITYMSLSSNYGDNISINFDKDFAEEVTVLELPKEFKDSSLKPWWLRNDAGHCDRIMEGLPVIAVEPWPDDLQFETKSKGKTDKLSNWKPEIIDGGKTKH